VARHEQANRDIATALATVEGVKVYLEPFITGTQRRDDISVETTRLCARLSVGSSQTSVASTTA
jgi:competence CoiA-like predicted nuclease